MTVDSQQPAPETFSLLTPSEVDELVALAPESVAHHLKNFLLYTHSPSAQHELASLARENNSAELEKRLSSRLEFGTAGLRGPMGAGFTHMNDLTVTQAALGLYHHLVEKNNLKTLQEKSIVLAFDRRHQSEYFAHLTGAVFKHHNVTPYIFNHEVPTPVLAYAIRKLKCAAGVMVTASHNPKQDNGYKVYAENGAQIVTPTDTEISKHILNNLRPSPEIHALLDTKTLKLPPTLFHDSTQEIVQAYVQETLTQLPKTQNLLSEDSSPKAIYTAMHGVGWRLVKQILVDQLKYQNLSTVEQQLHPDPEFPTVPFPNPEEKGAMDLAIAAADRHKADIVLANDPDADRFAAAEAYYLESGERKWHVFSGDELGILFAAHRLIQLESEQQVPRDKQLYVTTAVSSRMLEAFCKSEKVIYDETLTGFKWMGNCMIRRAEEEGLVPALAYEEAIGFAVGSHVFDKDGVCALANFIILAAYLRKERNQTVLEFFKELQSKYGYFTTDNLYVIARDPKQVDLCFKEKIREARKEGYPLEIGGYKVVRVRDVTVGYDSGCEGGVCAFPVQAGSNMVTFWFENGAVVTLRTSGTEPKLKYYAEMSDVGSLERAALNLRGVVRAVVNEVLCPEEYGFERVKGNPEKEEEEEEEEGDRKKSFMCC